MKARVIFRLIFMGIICFFVFSCNSEEEAVRSIPCGAVGFSMDNTSTRSFGEGWQYSAISLNGGSGVQAKTAVTTRGIPVTGTDAPTGSFGVLGYTLPGGVWSSSLTPSFMYNTQVTRQGNSGSYTYLYYPYKYWPDNTSDKVQFFAYYPYRGNGVTLSSQTTVGYPTIAYSPSTTVTDQVDLMYASSSAVNNKASGSAVSLALSHALTRVSFSVINGDTNIIKIQSIRLSGIRNKGTLSFDPSLSSNPWTLSTLSTDTTSYKISTTDGTLVPEVNQVFNTSTYQNVTGQSGYLLMLPQTITTKNQAIIYYTIAGKAKIAMLKLPASNWTKGTSINYQLVFGTANCYIVSPSTASFKIPIMNPNIFWGPNGDGNTPANVIGSSDTWTASVIWQDVSGLVTLTTSTGTGLGNIVLSTSSGTGNALIGIKKSGVSGYLWSWHVWVTSYDPSKTNVSYNSLTWMDRNLGATSNTETGTGTSYGLFYQWGRKDPFLHKNYMAVTGNTTCNLTNSVQNPTTFYYAGGTYTDWYTNTTGAQNNVLWGAAKTIYDPCPAGWKVPANSSWTGGTFTVSTYGVIYNGGFYPCTGYLDAYSGNLSATSSNGDYWSTTFNSSYAYNLSFDKSYVNPSLNCRGYGFNVRCVKE